MPQNNRAKIENYLSLIVTKSTSFALKALLFLSFQITQKMVSGLSLNCFFLPTIPSQARISFIAEPAMTHEMPSSPKTSVQRL